MYGVPAEKRDFKVLSCLNKEYTNSIVAVCRTLAPDGKELLSLTKWRKIDGQKREPKGFAVPVEDGFALAKLIDTVTKEHIESMVGEYKEEVAKGMPPTKPVTLSGEEKEEKEKKKLGEYSK